MIPTQPWRDEAACRDKDPRHWHPWPVGSGRDMSSTQARRLAQPAIAICNACPVRGQCLDYAIDTRQLDGVWGGLMPSDRKKVADGARVSA